MVMGLLFLGTDTRVPCICRAAVARYCTINMCAAVPPATRPGACGCCYKQLACTCGEWHPAVAANAARLQAILRSAAAWQTSSATAAQAVRLAELCHNTANSQHLNMSKKINCYSLVAPVLLQLLLRC